MSSSPRPLRILYLEDNPLIVFHIQAMIEDLGHVFAGSAGSFADLIADFDTLEIDGALVDIDLADGRTGPLAATWLGDAALHASLSPAKPRLPLTIWEWPLGPFPNLCLWRILLKSSSCSVRGSGQSQNRIKPPGIIQYG